VQHPVSSEPSRFDSSGSCCFICAAATCLDGAIVAPEVHHQALKLVMHAEDAAFVIASIPESTGAAADCGRRRPDGDPDFSAAIATGYLIQHLISATLYSP
jgi:hypothetical protein